MKALAHRERRTPEVTMSRHSHRPATAKMPWSAAQLDHLIVEATVDAYGASELQARFRLVINDVVWFEET
jgi:hypothetical protein